MKAIILAAGQGKRLRPLTNHLPKCMVKLNGKPLLKYQIDLLNKLGITDINVVTGYLDDKIKFKNIKKFYNANYDNTNMVATLFCANEVIDYNEDILILYGDIVYNENVLRAIVDAKEKLSVVIDLDWKKYWQARMENPLEDLETLKINSVGNIKEIGKKPSSYDDIEGQYIGIIKLRKDIVEDVKNFYFSLDKFAIYDGKNFSNMYMTSFLQKIADNLIPLTPVKINNGWIEIDEPYDLKLSRFLYN